MRITTILISAMLAGCATPEELPADDTPPNEVGDDRGLNEHLGARSFSWTAFVQGPQLFPGGVVANAMGAPPFDVPASSTVLYVNITWTCTSPTCDISAALYSPDGAEWDGEGASPLQATIQKPQNGTWQLGVAPVDASVEVQGSMQWTAFSPEEPQSRFA